MRIKFDYTRCESASASDADCNGFTSGYGGPERALNAEEWEAYGRWSGRGTGDAVPTWTPETVLA